MISEKEVNLINREKSRYYIEQNIAEVIIDKGILKCILHKDLGLDMIIQKAARLNKVVEKLLISILEDDYILYMFKDDVNYFIKRKKFKNLWHRVGKDIGEYKDVYYMIEEPKKIEDNGKKKLVVIFSSMPTSENYAAASVDLRMFTKNYYKIKEEIDEETMVLRIADVNWLAGSFYMNTLNYPQYESNICDLINFIINKNNISRDNVVLFGGSKGATAALIYGNLLDLKVVASDPIIDMKEYHIRGRNVTLLSGYVLEDVNIKFDFKVEKKEKIRVICSERVKETFEPISKIKNVSIYNNKDNRIETHPDVTKFSKEYIMSEINRMLQNC